MKLERYDYLFMFAFACIYQIADKIGLTAAKVVAGVVMFVYIIVCLDVTGLIERKLRGKDSP